MDRRRLSGRGTVVALLASAAALIPGAPAQAATPAGATVSPGTNAQGATAWSGAVKLGTETLKADLGALCFKADGTLNAGSGCDAFRLDVNVPAGFYSDHPGAVNVNVSGFGTSDLDLFIYRRLPDGRPGQYITGDGAFIGSDENASIDRAEGSYIVVVTPYTVLGNQSYTASARLTTRSGPSLAELEQAAPPGLTNYRASHDAYTSHSEPTIAMDPLDHNHLMAGSKMFENNDNYLFKIGTYESKDGGRTWNDQGHLPGYCQQAGQCDPANPAAYRTTSDVSLAYDDEGNAYANVLDAPGGTAASIGFNMTVHVKHPGQPWSGPTTVHDNRNNPLTEQLLLDDKNWIAVDNVTDVNGGSNKPNDGKIGTMYVCWSLDGTGLVPLQEIVLMRSVDGGRKWGGIVPGDNIPLPVSQKTLISGIGCHVIVGPHGEVYATWYDNQLNAIMQAKSTNRGRTFTPAAPIAGITGVNAPFAGESFRNLSLPSTAVDANGTIYVVASSHDSEGKPLLGNVFDAGKEIKAGTLDIGTLKVLLGTSEEDEGGQQELAGGDGAGPESGSDIVLFKSTNGGRSYTGPVRVNQDPPNGDGDQFQPWIAVTATGQVNVSFFDRRNDPGNYFIDTYLAQSEDGGATFHDQRVSARMWDPAVAAPTSVSGKFIGDYQGLVADDDAAIPFWNDTQLARLPKTDSRYSPYQEVFAARVPGDLVQSRCFPKRIKLTRRTIGKVRLRYTRARVGKRLGPPGKTRRGVLRYCVKGGGSALVAFDKKGRVRFLATTAKRHRRLKIGRGSTVKALRKRFGSRLRTVSKGILRVRTGTSRGIVFGIRGTRVRYVVLADRALLKSKRRLRTQLRRAALIRPAKKKKQSG
jgi:hypothetical protein